jgi:hypothetical protein
MEEEVDRCLSIGVPGVRNAAVNGYRVIRVSSSASPELPPALLLEDAADLLPELRNAIDDSLPDKQCVNAKIRVDQFVPHPCHLPPGNGRISLPDGQRDLFCRLTDDLEFPDDGALGPEILAQVVREIG